MKKINQNGIGFVQIFLVAFLVAAIAVGFRIYKNSEKTAELAHQELAKKQEIERKAESVKRLNEQKDKVIVVLRKWEDAVKLAGMTSRIALSEPVSQMQAIRREMYDFKNDECFNRATKSMAEGMNDAIFAFEMFIKFPNNGSASESTSKYLDSSNSKVTNALQELNGCAPESQ